MMTRGIVTLVLAVCWLTTHAVEYVIEGQIEGCDGTTVYLRDYGRHDGARIDSTKVVGGRFQLKGSYPRNAFARVDCGNHYSNCVLDTLAIVDFGTHYPKGGSLLNTRFRDLCQSEKAILDELGRFSSELQSHGFSQQECSDIFKLLYDKRRPDLMKLYTDAILGNDNGIGEAFVISLGNLWGLKTEEWDSVYRQMPDNLKNSSIARTFNDKYANIRKSQEGMPFLDFKAKGLKGKTVSLSDYVGKGKYVLVDFWASWCGPCKKEAAEVLMPLYKKYAGNPNFEILGVGVWDKPESILESLKNTPYPWAQIIDTDNSSMELYGFDFVPMIILFGPDGTILNRELRGDKLIETVDRCLSTP